MKKGFTLAEIMIVLTIIGVLTAILLPSAFQARPDANIMKFKKANSTLSTIIRELLTSDKYYANGDLGTMANGNTVQPDYLCESMADILTVKSTNCGRGISTIATTATTGGYYQIASGEPLTNNISTLKANLDGACNAIQADLNPDIITSDGISWYEVNPAMTFGMEDSGSRVFANPNSSTVKFPDANGFDGAYKVYCIDVDEIGEGADPYGYGIRADGRIISGALADRDINESIINNE